MGRKKTIFDRKEYNRLFMKKSREAVRREKEIPNPFIGKLKKPALDFKNTYGRYPSEDELRQFLGNRGSS